MIDTSHNKTLVVLVLIAGGALLLLAAGNAFGVGMAPIAGMGAGGAMGAMGSQDMNAMHAQCAGMMDANMTAAHASMHGTR